MTVMHLGVQVENKMIFKCNYFFQGSGILHQPKPTQPNQTQPNPTQLNLTKPNPTQPNPT